MNKGIKYGCLGIGLGLVILVSYISIGAKKLNDDAFDKLSEKEKLERVLNNIPDIDWKGDFKGILEDPDFDGKALENISFSGKRSVVTDIRAFISEGGELFNRAYKIMPDSIKLDIETNEILEGPSTTYKVNGSRYNKSFEESKLSGFNGAISVKDKVRYKFYIR